jgi:hypothetical protein
MKKLLFLASYVIETKGTEYQSQQLVLVTDRDVEVFTEKQKEFARKSGRIVRETFEPVEAAYDLFDVWFKETFPGSEIRHVICTKPISSEHLPKSNVTPTFRSDFGAPHSCKDELPPTEEGEDFTETVAIDLTGEMKHWDFGWYDHEEKKWVMQNQGELFANAFELEHAKWFATPKPK